MSEITIEPFHPRYRDAFRELNLEWIRTYFRVEQKDVEQTNNPEACILEGGHIIFAVRNNEAIGTCALYVVPPEKAGAEEKKVFELAKMAVRPDCRGLGIGDKLMVAAHQWARIAGADEVMLLSNTILEPAIALYIKHGFEVTKLGPHPDYDRCNIEMRKKV
jgi:GNAT superfamily N-acetyltransferase